MRNAEKEADECPHIWWVIDGADPDGEAQAGGFTCLTDSRRIRMERTSGATAKGEILESLRRLGASEELIESLRWVLPITGGEGEVPKDLESIRAITIYSSAGMLL